MPAIKHAKTSNAEWATLVSRQPSSIAYPAAKERVKTHPRVTPFQWSVYDLVKEIPSGKISTYAQVARKLQTSPRAVGNALRANPFCPLVPCHRVVAANGKLGGFFGQTTGFTMDTKARMLKDEGLALRQMPDGAYALSPNEMQVKLWSGKV